MSTIFTHIYRVRAIHALLFLSSASLWAQSDDATLTNITNLEQLHAIRYDLNGDGVVSFTTAASLTGSPMFSDRAAVVTLMGADSIYAQAFTSGAFYAAADGIAAATGAVAVSTTYYYKLSSAATSPYIGYELMNNLDFKNGSTDPTMYSIWAEGSTATGAVSEGWAPIGDYSNAYTATLDGRGYTISNLYINRSSTNGVGLFGRVSSSGEVRNLGIVGGSVTGRSSVGGLVGFSFGTISACYATGNATSGGSSVGGLVGQSYGTISACYATGDASGTGNNVGGLMGENEGTISACYATGDATSRLSSVGGLVGSSSGTISACYATGDASGADDVGGLVGYNSGGTISACYATGNATGTGALVGGLVGGNEGTVTNSYFDSETSGIATGTGAQTTAQLQAPTVYDDNADATDGSSIYEAWNIDVDDGLAVGVDDGTMAGDSDTDKPWDFGTSSQYPVLRVDFNVNGTPTAFEFGGQERAAPTAPAAPSALTAAAANTAVTLSWTAPVNDGGAPIINYMVEYDTDMNFSSPPTTVPTATAVTSHTVSGLTNGTLYYFRVAAVNAVGTGASATAVSATPAVQPLAISSISPTSGLVGATVTITGTGFSTTATDNTVTFLGEAADADNAVVMTVSAATATELTVTVPSGAVTGRISVTVGGQTATSSTDFTVLMSVPPTDTDDDELINITTLAQLDAIRYDLNGDGVVSFTTAASLTGSPMFSDRAAVVAVMGDTSAYAEAFASGAFYAAADGIAAATGAVAASTAYYYKLSSMATSPYTGYELRNNLDFEDADGDGTADDKSIWAEGATAAGVPDAVAGGWAPLGHYNSVDDFSSYTATFDGRGHTISNLYINRPSANYVGLFGFLGNGSNVRNLGIVGGSLTGNAVVSGLVGWNQGGTISACYATGDASGASNVGGLVGYNQGTISACYATGNATGTGDTVGGLVGRNSEPISACYATGNATGADNVGGLVGQNSKPISACYSTGDASGNDGVGGLVGFSSSTISACYATGNASGTNNVGGLVGDNSGGTISACYATGDASGNDGVGGLVGFSSGTISACYATGNASGTNNVGGLVGLNQGGTVTNSYFDSTVNSALATTPIGGTSTGSNITNVSGKTTAQLQTPTAYDDNADATDGSSIYEAWNIDVDDGLAVGVDDGTAAGDSDTDNLWDFGTSSQYPVLKVDFDGNSTATAFEFGGQGRAAPATVPDAPVVSSFTPTSGAVATTVMIIGTGFSTTAADNTVTFLGEAGAADNAVVMTVSAATATELTVTVPSSAVTGKIQVEVNSVVAVSSDDFTVLMSVPPTDTDDDELINITTLTQLDAIRYDLDGDGVVSFTTAASLTGSPMFSDRAAVVTLMGADSIYAQAFTSGDFYTAAAGIVAATGAVAVSTTYYYKLSSMATSPYTGYELRNNLDFEDADGNGTADDKSIWAEGAGTAGVSGAVAEGWAPIGYYNSPTDKASYTAIFDGRGHTISNLYINRPSTNSIGLFGFLGAVGNVRNLGIEGGSLSGDDYVGGLVGKNDFGGTISACYATGTPSGSSWVGGLVGYNEGTISACYATGDATGTGNYVGGLVGNNTVATISACYATGAATGIGDYVGGLAGSSSGTIRACYATGDASGDDYVGGLVGDHLTGTIRACYATGNATSGSSYVGGLAGYNASATISACYSTGDATGSSDVGGLVGNNDSGTISACYATGDATGSGSNVGGGLVGRNSGTVTNSYFDSETSGIATGTGAKTTADLQTPTAYGTAADIYANWNIDVDDGLAVGVDDATMAGDSDTDDPWDFGTSSQYPVLRVDFNVNGTPTAFEFGGQGRAAPTAPDAPTALTATAADAAVTLNWTAAASDGGAPITGYMIEYDTDMNFSSPPTTATTAAAATSHTVSGLINGTLYYFRVAAANSVGTGASGTAVSATPAPATAPTAPSALMAAAANTAVTLSWTAPTSDGGAPIINYMVEYDTDMNFSSSPMTVSTAADVTSHTISGLTNATPYYFRVAAVNSVGTGAYYPGATDAAVTATPAPTAPSAPSALMAAAANTEVTLSWTAAASDGGAAITGYMVEYDTDMNFPSPTPVTTTDATTSHTVSTLTNATPYYFRVAAVNAVGTGAYYPGATDAAVSATPAPTAPTAPAAPSALMAAAANAAVTLNWTTPTSDGGAAITGYMVEYDTDMNFSSSPTTVPTATAATSYIVSALTNATPYYFRVAAVNAAGTGAYYPGATDAAVSATPAPTAPAAPSALMAMAANAAVTLNWTAPSDNGGAAITGYMVEYSVNADFSSSPTTVAAPTTSHTVSALTNATPYYFRVAAVNSVGTGAYYPGATDAAVSATPTPPPPVVSSFSPIEGVVDTEVTITGDNFSATAPENDVRFGGVTAADPTSASTTSLTVKVPSGAVTGRISVAVGSQTGTSSTDFTVTGTTPAPDPPVVLSFSPSEGEVGISVTITGDNFSDMSSENEVRFGGVMSEDPTSASTTSLVVLVPSGARTGRVSVAVGSQTGTSSTDFTVTGTTPAPDPPVVLSFSPSEGEVGISVTITGENFSATALENEVKFGGVMAEDPTSASTTSLVVLVPSGAVTGSISVAVGGQTGTSSTDFTVTGTTPAPDPPVVLSFSPSEGEVGISVTITGENFSATALENEVKFGGVMAAAPTSASTTTLTVRVPSGARTGSISVAVGGQTGTSSTNFTVTGTTPEPAAFSVPLSSEGDVRVYPNPTSGQLHFKGLLAGGRYVCDLYSLVGQKVLSSVVRAGDMMDTSTLSSGQYILILQAEGRELMRTRLLVVR